MLLLLFQSVQAQTVPDDPSTCGVINNNSTTSDLPFQVNSYCNDPTLVKYIPLAFHFVLTDDPTASLPNEDCGVNWSNNYPGNFTERSDGNGDWSYTGYDWAKDIIDRLNFFMSNNNDIWRKAAGISYPSTPPDINIQFMLEEVNFIRKHTVWSARNSSGHVQMFNQHNVGGDEVIDVFFVPNFTDHSGYASGLGGNKKYVFQQVYRAYRACNGNYPLDFAAGLLQHELGHTLHLRHSWPPNDNCNDTKPGYVYDKVKDNGGCLMNQRANCWVFDASIPGCPRKPCDTWSKITNNVMDYNGYFADHAFSVCQIDRMHTHLSNFDSYIHSCTGCAPATSFFAVESTCRYVEWGSNGNYVRNGVIIDANGAHNGDLWRLDICELNSSGNCTNNTFATSWYNGQPGRLDLFAYFNFQHNKEYRVVLTNSSSNCPMDDSYTREFTVMNCSKTVDPDILDVSAVTNPFDMMMSINYTTNQKDYYLSFYLMKMDNGQLFTLEDKLYEQSSGSVNKTYSTQHIPAGNYILYGILDDYIDTKTLIKL